MPYIMTCDATSLYYEDDGEGRPLLFIHGWSSSSRIWAEQKDHFARRYRCITLDLRGHGCSQPSPSGYGIGMLSSDVETLFDALSLSGVTLVGWSLGVLVALAAYPAVHKRLSALVLVSGTAKYCSTDEYPHGLPPKEPRSLSVLLKRDPRKAMEGFTQKIFSGEEGAESTIHAFEQEFPAMTSNPSAEILDQVLGTLATADMRGVLPLVRVPTLLIHGDRDLVCPMAASCFLADRIPGSELVPFSGVGHAPMFSRAIEFNAVVGAFLERIHASH